MMSFSVANLKPLVVNYYSCERKITLSANILSSRKANFSRFFNAGRIPRHSKFMASSSQDVATTNRDEATSESYINNKTVIVTGANTGMGLETARELATKGAHVILACRSEKKGREAEETVWRAIKASGSQGSAVYAPLDLSSLTSVREFSNWFLSKYEALHCLINNAGIMIPPHSYTVDGFESQFQVNHLSHYLLTRLLLPTLISTPGTSSVIHISSMAGERTEIQKGEFELIAKRTPETYQPWTAYRQSKLAQVLFTVETERRYGGQIVVNSVHPGIVNTELLSRNINPVVKLLLAPLGFAMVVSGTLYSTQKGASTAIYLATTPPEKIGSGGYFADCAPKAANPVAFDVDLGKEWWEESAKLVGLDP